MRAAILGLVLAACSPDIESGAYICGPEQSCPPGDQCNGADNTCVDPITAVPFACLPEEEHEPDNTPAQGQQISSLACVSAVFSQDGCLAAGDDADWYRFTTPTGCNAIEVDLRVEYPVRRSSRSAWSSATATAPRSRPTRHVHRPAVRMATTCAA